MMIRLRPLVLFTLLAPLMIQAQIYIEAGAGMYISDSLDITVQDMNWENHGNFHAGKGKIKFVSNDGHSIIAIKGSKVSRFHHLTLDRGTNAILEMESDIYIDGNLEMKSGNLNMGSYMISLGDYPGNIIGEREESYISGEGMIVKAQELNRPKDINPGNLGITISSRKDLGQTLLIRQHQTTWLAGVPSINRQYTIQPETDQQLNADITFTYLDIELNGLDEDALVYWHEKAGKWKKANPRQRNKSRNRFSISNLKSLGKFTLSLDTQASESRGFEVSEDVSRVSTPKDLITINTYPNPTSDRLMVELSESTTEVYEVIMTNGYGQTLYKKGLLPGSKKFRMDMANIPQGFYILMINGKDARIAQQVVFKR